MKMWLETELPSSEITSLNTMPKPYAPPFSSTPTIVSLVAEIAEAIGRQTVASESAAALQLRWVNRI